MDSVFYSTPMLVLLAAALICAALGSRPRFFAGCLISTAALVLLALVRGAGLGEIAVVLLLETEVCLLSGKGGMGG